MPKIITFKVTLRGGPPLPSLNLGDRFQLRMEHLSDLTISSTCETHETGVFLGYIVLPALTRLDYTDITTEARKFKTWSHAAFINFLIRSACHIKRLVMYIGGSLNKSDIDQLLHLAPELEHFGISTNSEIRCTPFILSLLTYSTEKPGPCLVPRLKSVALEECGIAKWRRMVDDLLLMLESRWKARSDLNNTFDGPLERVGYVNIQSDDHKFYQIPQANLQRMSRLIAEGLVVQTIDRVHDFGYVGTGE